MNCFLCGTNMDTIRFMQHHFRLVHSITDNRMLKCTFGGTCNVFCSSIRAFSRHVERHMQIPVDAGVGQVNTESDNSPNDSVSVSIETLPESSSGFSLPSTVIDSNLSNIFEMTSQPASPNYSIEQNGVQFALQLHSNTNFSRKDVNQIQKSVVRLILNPIVDAVDQFFTRYISQIADDDDIDRQLLHVSLMDNISSSFRLCGNEQQLFSWLSRNDYISDFHEFIIDREITGKHSRGELRYEEVDITGVLLSLSFQFRKTFEKNDRLLQTLKHMSNIERATHFNSNFLHGSLWKQKKSFLEPGHIAMPYFL